jgi:endoglucanase
MKKIGIISATLAVLAATAVFGGELPRGEWRCVALTPRLLALTGDYQELQLQLFRRQMEKRLTTKKKLPKWAKEFIFNISGTEAIAMYRPRAVAMLRDFPKVTVASKRGNIPVVRTAYWMNPTGQARFTDYDGKLRVTRNADTAHFLFLELERPLDEAEALRIALPAGEEVEFVYHKDAPSPLFRTNQLGYMPQAPKYAYLGAWLGTGGPLPLHREFSGAKFELVDAATRRTVFTGELKARPADPVTAKGTPFTGEEVLELDFSRFNTPGRYYLAVEKLGRSYDFAIGDDTMAEAFYIHARGLYHQRCGIAKEKPYTNWTLPACHQTCVRGTFPPDIAHYDKGDDQRPYGFRDESGESLKVNHFKLIAQNVPENPEILHAVGGWHDAADWDRRPQHLDIVGDLAAVYLLKPNNFCDGQLDLPESGNGIPDILDEAAWGLEHLRSAQQPDGGVGTWIETTRHPGPDSGSSADDRMTYYLSCATRNSTLEYAAYAAELALALKQAGAEKRAELFRDSAKRAWDFATDAKNRVQRTYRYEGATITYREEPELSPRYLVKAGFDLFQLTGDQRYLEAAELAAKSAREQMKKQSWSWSPFFWIELEIFPCYGELNRLRGAWRKSLHSQARTMRKLQEWAYPIRAPWFGPNDGWVHTMSWGTSHPLRRARMMVAAHALVSDMDCLDGAYLANDFHNGANPFGSTMTSGLGRVYPVRFLHLDSYSDGIAEFVPGITPYRNTFGLPRKAVTMAYGLFYPANKRQNFAGLKLSLLPKSGLNEGACVRAIGKTIPIWRRWGNVEGQTVAASEFTVWETIAPAAAVTGYLLNGARQPDPAWKNRRPAENIRDLPGYAPLP